MLHAINSPVLTGKNPYITTAIHMLLMHGFAVLHISIPGPSQNLTSSAVTCTLPNVISWRQHDVSLCPGSGVFKTFTGNVPFRACIKRPFRVIFSTFSSEKMFYAMVANKHVFWYINICINICWAPREMLKPSLFRLGFQHLPGGPADVNA